MNTPDMLTHVESIGKAGGSLTLRYNEGDFTLTGDELLFAVEDYDMGAPFEIVPIEPAGSEPDATPEPLSNAARVLAMATVAVAFIGLGLFLTL